MIFTFWDYLYNMAHNEFSSSLLVSSPTISHNRLCGGDCNSCEFLIKQECLTLICRC